MNWSPCFTDYDWADEVFHAQIGRKWLAPEFANMEEMNALKDQSVKKFWVAMEKFSHLSDQEDWWTRFMEEFDSSLSKKNTDNSSHR